jgi:hypothetical protein
MCVHQDWSQDVVGLGDPYWSGQTTNVPMALRYRLYCVPTRWVHMVPTYVLKPSSTYLVDYLVTHVCLYMHGADRICMTHAVRFRSELPGRGHHYICSLGDQIHCMHVHPLQVETVLDLPSLSSPPPWGPACRACVYQCPPICCLADFQGSPSVIPPLHRPPVVSLFFLFLSLSVSNLFSLLPCSFPSVALVRISLILSMLGVLVVRGPRLGTLNGPPSSRREKVSKQLE